MMYHKLEQYKGYQILEGDSYDDGTGSFLVQEPPQGDLLNNGAPYPTLEDAYTAIDTMVANSANTGRKNLWQAVHEHKHGDTPYLFLSTAADHQQLPDALEVARMLDIDFEPEKDEFLEFFLIGSTDIPDLDELIEQAGK